MFIAIVVSLFIGACIGFFAATVCHMAARNDWVGRR
jgi:hypothetical protein